MLTDNTALVDEKGKKKKCLQKLEHCEKAKASRLTHLLCDCHQAGGVFWAEG